MSMHGKDKRLRIQKFWGKERNVFDNAKVIEATDADVVETNLVEIELGLFGVHRQKQPGPDELTLEVPDIRFNYGLPWDSELVLETAGELIDSEYTGELGIKEKQFTDTVGFFKKVWWRAERGGWMPNFATET